MFSKSDDLPADFAPTTTTLGSVNDNNDGQCASTLRIALSKCPKELWLIRWNKLWPSKRGEVFLLTGRLSFDSPAMPEGMMGGHFLSSVALLSGTGSVRAKHSWVVLKRELHVPMSTRSESDLDAEATQCCAVLRCSAGPDPSLRPLLTRDMGTTWVPSSPAWPGVQTS